MSSLDSLTKERLINYFSRRGVCDEEDFAYFFNRELLLYENQYMEKLRLELVEIDPMVADYMERQITVEGADGHNVNRSGTKSNNSNVDNKTVGSRSNTTTNQSKTDTVNNQMLIRNLQSEIDGEDKDNLVRSSKQTTLGTGGQSEISENSDESEVNAESSSETNKRELQGLTPDSSMYGVAGSYKIDRNGLPGKLNWLFTSQQAEGDYADMGNNHEKRIGSSDGKKTLERDLKDVVDGNGEDDRDFKTHRLTSDTGNISTDDKGESLTIASGDLDEKSSFDNSVQSVGSEQESGNEIYTGNHSNDTRERYSGRHEAPQDLLNRAWKWVGTANAFKWLCQQLDSCFYLLYDVY